MQTNEYHSSLINSISYFISPFMIILFVIAEKTESLSLIYFPQINPDPEQSCQIPTCRKEDTRGRMERTKPDKGNRACLLVIGRKIHKAHAQCCSVGCPSTFGNAGMPLTTHDLHCSVKKILTSKEVLKHRDTITFISISKNKKFYAGEKNSSCRGSQLVSLLCPLDIDDSVHLPITWPSRSKFKSVDG